MFKQRYIKSLVGDIDDKSPSGKFLIGKVNGPIIRNYL